jgi:competence protein ComEC
VNAPPGPAIPESTAPATQGRPGWQAAPLAPLVGAWVAGLVLAETWPQGSRWALPAALAALLAAVGALAARRQRTATATLLVAVTALAAARACPLPLPADHVARAVDAAPSGRLRAQVEGRVTTEPRRWAPDRLRVLLEAEAVIQDGTRRPARGLVQVTLHGPAPPIGAGQRLRVEAALARPVGFRNPGGFDYPAMLGREGIRVTGSGRAERATPLTPDAPPWPVGVKRRAVAQIEQHLPETSAALLAGLILGERAALPREVDAAFRRAGVYHILAVSGFNVGLLSGAVLGGLALVGAPRRGAALVAGAVVVAFALVVGGEPSVVRATVMALLALAALLLERRSALPNALALAGLILLGCRPQDLWDPGFQASFAATAAIVALAPPLAAWLGQRGWPGWLAAGVAVSLAAQAGVTPVMAAHFNQASLAGVAVNLVVVPLAAAATTLGLLGLGLGAASETLAAWLLNAVWPVLLAIRLAVRLAAAWPWAMLHVPAPGWVASGLWYAGLGMLARPSGPAGRGAAAALLATAAGLGLAPWLTPGDGRLRVTFLDVGQGDATLVELPDGARLLVDGGPAGPRRFDVGERVLAPFLWNLGVRRLDVVAMSHSDPDHAGGLAAVVRHFAVGEFWETGRWGAGVGDLERALAEARPPRRLARAGDRVWAGQGLIQVLHPAGTGEPDENDDSLVLRLDWRGVSVLLTGDLGARGEEALLRRGPPLRALVVKVAHHGSRGSSGAAFLDAARPAVAVISAGPGNPFGHPAAETLGRLAAAGARVYRTDQDGAVILETDGATLWITRWAPGRTELLVLEPPLPAAAGNTTAPEENRGP